MLIRTFKAFYKIILIRFFIASLGHFLYFYLMILITGATGLVGFHLMQLLSKEDTSIRALYRSEVKKDHIKNLFEAQNQLDYFEQIEWFQADILDIPKLEEAFKDITQVYHCAALVSFDPKDYKELYKNNIVGTANVVNLCLAFGIEKLCHVSSIAALGNGTEHNLCITEETERNNELHHSDYSISKYGAELEVWRGYQEGLNVVIVNPGVIFGRGFKDLGSSLFFSKIKNGLPFYTKGKVGIIAVEDVVKVMQQLMKSPISGERYILVAEDITFENLFTILAHAFGVNPPKIEAKKAVTSIFWRLDWFFSKLLFTKRKLTQSTAQSLFNQEYHDCNKIKTAIEFEFTNMSTYLTELAKEFK